MSYALLLLEFRIRRRSILGWGLIVVLWVGLVIWFWSSLGESIEEFQRILEQTPEEYIRFFAKGVIQFLSYPAYYVVNYYAFVYILLLGAFMAYVGAGVVVDDVLYRSGGLTLLAPLGRSEVLLVRLASLILIAAVITMTSLITSIILQELLVGEPLGLSWLLKLHAAGALYLVACASLGLLAGAILPFNVAKPGATGIIVVMYIVDATTSGTSLERLGLLTITRYYPALDIATQDMIPIVDVIILTIIMLIIITLAIVFYNRRDLPL